MQGLRIGELLNRDAELKGSQLDSAIGFLE